MKLYPNVTLIFLIWVASILTVLYLGFANLPQSGLFPNADFVKSLGNWDGGHYLGIADGYDEKFQYAFFPLYPMLVGLIGNQIHNFLWAGILISIISSWLAVNFLYELVSLEFDKKLAEKAVLALLLFPTAFYLITVYTEGLFFMLTVGTFLFIRKKNLLLATVLAALASATRLTGLGVVLGLWINVWATGGLNRKNWFVVLAPVGFLAYCYFLWVNTGDPFYFIQAESHWQRSLEVPGASLLKTISDLATPGFLAGNFNIFLDFLLTVLGVGLVVRVYRLLPLDYAVFSIFSLILPLFSPTLLAMPRYLLTIFPIFIIMALYKNKYLVFGYQVLGTLLLAGYAILFITGYWVS